MDGRQDTSPPTGHVVRSPSTCARATSAAGPSAASGTASGRCPSCGTTCCWAPTPISSSPGSRPARSGCGCCPHWCDRSTRCATWCRWSRCGACSVAARTRWSSPTSRRQACSPGSRRGRARDHPAVHSLSMASFGPGYGRLENCCSRGSNGHWVPDVGVLRGRCRPRAAVRRRSASPATGCTSCAPACPLPSRLRPRDEARRLLDARHGTRPGRPLVCYVGSLEPRKNPLLLARLLRQLHDRSADPPDLLVVGDGPERERLTGELAALGLCRPRRPHRAPLGSRPRARRAPWRRPRRAPERGRGAPAGARAVGGGGHPVRRVRRRGRPRGPGAGRPGLRRSGWAGSTPSSRPPSGWLTAGRPPTASPWPTCRAGPRRRSPRPTGPRSARVLGADAGARSPSGSACRPDQRGQGPGRPAAGRPPARSSARPTTAAA